MQYYALASVFINDSQQIKSNQNQDEKAYKHSPSVYHWDARLSVNDFMC